jgi:Zn-dependent alcohol dehydrogenase
MQEKTETLKFKAALLTELNKPLQIVELETTELQVGQVLVKVLVSGICGAQLQEMRGDKGNGNYLPHPLGHEGVGIVEKIGVGVTTVAVGDKVVMHWRKGDGIESVNPSYLLDGKKITSGKVTTLSEYSIVSENRVTKVSQQTPEYLAALLGCGLTTALGVIENEAEIKLAESVMVVGCGGVGLNLIQGAKLVSAYPIFAVDIVEEKRSKSLEVGADVYINSVKESLEEILGHHLTSGKVDVIIDTTGIPEVISKTSSLLSDKGRFIFVSQPRPGQQIVIPNGKNIFNGQGSIFKATQGGKTNPTESIPRFINLHKSGKLQVDNIVTHEFTLEEINKAFDLLKTGNAGRIMIRINKEL